MSLAHEIHHARFAHGEPRSPEYRAGALYILQRKAGEVAEQLCPYTLGSAQADAWFAGCDAGHLLWQRVMEELA